ncbi:MAG: hypothetical protein ACLS6W_00825 [Ruminococcus sp.]
MPVIDFHTHVFPEAIAEKTISMLAQKRIASRLATAHFPLLFNTE